MPIYEYQCKKCNTISEFIVFAEEESLRCKSCGSTDLLKLISAHHTVQPSSHVGEASGGCCGAPHSCSTPGSCCGK